MKDKELMTTSVKIISIPISFQYTMKNEDFPSPFQTHNGSRFKDGSIHEQLFQSVSFLNTEFRMTKCQGNNI